MASHLFLFLLTIELLRKRIGPFGSEMLHCVNQQFSDGVCLLLAAEHKKTSAAGSHAMRAVRVEHEDKAVVASCFQGSIYKLVLLDVFQPPGMIIGNKTG